ncbi:hypothetical protein NP233_g7879 [Leucocoprinus birnbaumii]|uniref:MFS general substrate transporter n=1 Tax=Leucocoprinus birnbaumii TaxID=56174 RepID=A0AAD5VQ13_9AGAR|nr:hypothetical protein NP233_g7879 [Leucocoprinus birnbaumii]
MISEESPLLLSSQSPASNDPDLVYQRFTPFHKKVLVAIVSWCGLLPLFISGTFYPSIPQIARDLNSTGELVSFTVSISVLSTSIGALAASSYATFYGRRRVYLALQPLSVIGSFGVASARSMRELLFWRVWQCAGASPGLAVGAAVIGDIYKLEERGTAMGWFLGVSLLIMRLGGRCKYALAQLDSSCLMLRKSIAGFFALLTDYVLLIPLAYTIGKRYHLDHNEALVGACFLPCGLGNIVGATTAGRLADKTIIYWKRERNGVWYPEDRLRASFVGALVLVPLSVLGCGLITQYIEGRLGLMLNLISLFLNGVGTTTVLSPIVAYSVDILQARSAEAMACNAGFRNFLLTFAIAGVMPAINNLGLVTTNLISAALAWVGFILLVLVVRYGDHLRALTKVEYSIVEND